MLPFSEQIPALKQAYNGALYDRHRESTYVLPEDLNLRETADSQPWEPSESICNLRTVVWPNIHIEPITESTDLTLVRNKLVASKHVGLVLMGRKISRFEKPSLIVITTEDTYYIIEPNDRDRGIRFLKLQIEDKKSKVTFWTTNGLAEAECLKHNYNITLYKSRAKCCTGVHINLMKFMSHLPREAENNVRFYPEWLIRQSRHPPKLETFERLVEIWLEINKQEISYDVTQLAHLNCRPLNLTAKNLILKRCILVRCLAETLQYYSTVELNEQNASVMTALRECTSVSDMRKALEAQILQGYASEETHPIYFSYLDYGK